ncbi:MAG: ComF family protein [Raineya sp.]
MKLLKDFLHLLFPDCCYSCQGVLFENEEKICTACRANLPFTNFHKQSPEDNPITQKFFGKIPIKYGLAFLQFSKSGKVQRILHRIKYQNQPELAQMLGNWYGYELAQNQILDFDYILPVPLHPSKLKIRGYNQSDYFAQGLSEQMQITWKNDLLLRNIATSTQTKKNRLERWKNVKNVFELSDGGLVSGKSVLIVDDVVTTGSTLEACAKVLLDAEAKHISVAAIALA